MAVRIRVDGSVWCAAMTEAEPGDTYLHDGIHYRLSVELKLLVTESIDGHRASGGRWWWKLSPRRRRHRPVLPHLGRLLMLFDLHASNATLVTILLVLLILAAVFYIVGRFR